MYNLIKNYPWKEDKIGYVVYRGIPMHSFIIGQFYDLDEFEVIDHADRNKMNNRLNNLRLTNYQNNTRNRSLHKNNKIGIIGVCKKYKTQKGICYRAHITNNDGKRIELCTSYDVTECIVARLKAEKDIYGEFAPQKHLFDKYGII